MCVMMCLNSMTSSLLPRYNVMIVSKNKMFANAIHSFVFVFIGPRLDDKLKENLKKNPETLKGCPLFSLSCRSVPELQSTPFDLGT